MFDGRGHEGGKGFLEKSRRWEKGQLIFHANERLAKGICLACTARASFFFGGGGGGVLCVFSICCYFVFLLFFLKIDCLPGLSRFIRSVAFLFLFSHSKKIIIVTGEPLVTFLCATIAINRHYL